MPLVNNDVPIGFPRWDHRHYVFGKRGHNIENIAFFRIQHPLHGRLQIFLVNHTFALHSKTAAKLDIVRVNPLSVSWIAQERVTSIAVVEPIFPLHDHPKMLVVDDDDLCSNPFHVSASQFLDVHQE